MRVVNLSTVADYEAQNKDILTGAAGGDAHISIADGAVVILRGVTISPTDSTLAWPAILCKGDATIILEGMSLVKCCHYRYPGILVPEGKTLVIEGPGSLSVCSKGNGAGIGGGYQVPCGNIHIKSGFIVAQGGMGGAGIGGGYYAACGSIRIEGGTITALAGNMAAAIGSGLNGTCGDITLVKGVIYLTARLGECGDYSVESIGRGAGGKCGTVINDLPEESISM